MGNTSRKYKTGSAISKDGTTVRYRKIGAGSGVILLHGGANASQNYMRLGKALSDVLTAYIPDRRGRSLGEPFGDGYGIQKEFEAKATICRFGSSFRPCTLIVNSSLK